MVLNLQSIHYLTLILISFTLHLLQFILQEVYMQLLHSHKTQWVLLTLILSTRLKNIFDFKMLFDWITQHLWLRILSLLLRSKDWKYWIKKESFQFKWLIMHGRLFLSLTICILAMTTDIMSFQVTLFFNFTKEHFQKKFYQI